MFSWIFPFFIGMAPFVSSTAGAMARERQSCVRELMNMMGLGDLAWWNSWLAVNLVQVFATGYITYHGTSFSIFIFILVSISVYFSHMCVY